jgi:sensor domain CHASE-containing protein
MLTIGYGARFMGDVSIVLEIDRLLSKLKSVNERYFDGRCCLYGEDAPRMQVQILDRDFVFFANEDALNRAREELDNE